MYIIKLYENKLLQNYSAHTLKHFNYSKIHRGLCVTDVCKSYLRNEILSLNEKSFEENITACLNDSLWIDYQLQVSGIIFLYCESNKRNIKIDAFDITVAIIYVILIMFNIVGSFYDLYMKKSDRKGIYIFHMVILLFYLYY